MYRGVMTTKPPPHVWHLDRDGRLSPRADNRDWRVVAADQERVDPAADYLFCAPDFLFPADGVGRALRLEVDAPPPKAGRSGGSRWGTAMKPGK